MSDLPSHDVLERTARPMCHLLHEAWLVGLCSASNGNASVRLPDPFSHYLAMTARGSMKGHLTLADISLLDLPSLSVRLGPPCSSECGVHVALYAKTTCSAVLHTHPPHLLALDILLSSAKDQGNVETSSVPHYLKALPLYEAALGGNAFGLVDAYAPGSPELAQHVGEEAETMALHQESCQHRGALWMHRHGLVTWGATLLETLSLTEELNHLAEIALLTNRVQSGIEPQ